VAEEKNIFATKTQRHKVSQIEERFTFNIFCREVVRDSPV